MEKYKYTSEHNVILDITNHVVNGEKFASPKCHGGAYGILKAYKAHVLRVERRKK